MYGLRDTPEPIEKIRKPQWTVENTRATQAVVDRLCAVRSALRVIAGDRDIGGVVHAINLAVARFEKLDPKVKA